MSGQSDLDNLHPRCGLDVSRRAAMAGTFVSALILAGGETALALAKETEMEKVLGIGGFFFRAKDPPTLAKWYSDNLGINLAPQSYDAEPWRTEAGVTIFSPFETGTDYFGDWRVQWMINFRVRSLDAMVEQLRRNGIQVDVDSEAYPNGRFAKLNDPDGNAIQLWQPA